MRVDLTTSLTLADKKTDTLLSKVSISWLPNKSTKL